MHESRNVKGEVVLTTWQAFLVVRTFLERQLETKGPIASRGGSVPVFFKESHF